MIRRLSCIDAPQADPPAVGWAREVPLLTSCAHFRRLGRVEKKGGVGRGDTIEEGAVAPWLNRSTAKGSFLYHGAASLRGSKSILYPRGVEQ